MPSAGSLHIIESSEASARLREAERWLAARADRGALIVSASRGAADEIARAVARARGATAGLHRFSFAQLAAQARGAGAGRPRHRAGHAHRLGSRRRTRDVRRPSGRGPHLLRRRCRNARIPARAGAHAPGSGDGGRGAGRAGRSPARRARSVAPAAGLRRAVRGRVRHRPGGTLHGRLRGPRGALPPSAPPARRPDGIGGRVRAGKTPDRSGAGDADHRPVRRPRHARPSQDARASRSRHSSRPATRISPRCADRSSPAGSRPQRQPLGDVQLFSAPGEGRECVEIARRILEEVARGVRFDEIAVFLRSPREYLGLVENAFERAGINAWFDRGARRPHPSGRAFLAILSCAVERLSAVRFAEYLSLAQVPEANAARPRRSCRRPTIWSPGSRVSTLHQTAPTRRTRARAYRRRRSPPSSKAGSARRGNGNG